MNTKPRKLREEAQQCVRVADRTIDNRLAAALLAYACELEQRAKLIESTKNQLSRRSPLEKRSPKPRRASISSRPRLS